MLQSLDLGLATSPRQAIQKKRFRCGDAPEHGLPVLVTRDDWRLRGIELQSKDMSSRLLTPKEFALLDTLPAREEFRRRGMAGSSGLPNRCWAHYRHGRPTERKTF